MVHGVPRMHILQAQSCKVEEKYIQSATFYLCLCFCSMNMAVIIKVFRLDAVQVRDISICTRYMKDVTI